MYALCCISDCSASGELVRVLQHKLSTAPDIAKGRQFDRSADKKERLSFGITPQRPVKNIPSVWSARY